LFLAVADIEEPKYNLISLCNFEQVSDAFPFSILHAGIFGKIDISFCVSKAKLTTAIGNFIKNKIKKSF